MRDFGVILTQKTALWFRSTQILNFRLQTRDEVYTTSKERTIRNHGRGVRIPKKNSCKGKLPREKHLQAVYHPKINYHHPNRDTSLIDR